MNNEQMQQFRNKVKKRQTPLKAIKNYCRRQCCCEDTISWKKCTLYKYRLGLGNKSKKRTIEEKQASTPLNFNKNEASE